jgi:hypothetical protein
MSVFFPDSGCNNKGLGEDFIRQKSNQVSVIGYRLAVHIAHCYGKYQSKIWNLR